MSPPAPRPGAHIQLLPAMVKGLSETPTPGPAYQVLESNRAWVSQDDLRKGAYGVGDGPQQGFPGMPHRVQGVALANPLGLPFSLLPGDCPSKYPRGSSLYSPLPLATQDTQQKIQQTWRLVKLLEPSGKGSRIFQNLPAF